MSSWKSTSPTVGSVGIALLVAPQVVVNVVRFEAPHSVAMFAPQCRARQPRAPATRLLTLEATTKPGKIKLVPPLSAHRSLLPAILGVRLTRILVGFIALSLLQITRPFCTTHFAEHEQAAASIFVPGLDICRAFSLGSVAGELVAEVVFLPDCHGYGG